MDDNVAVKGVRLVTLLVQNNEMSQDQARSLVPFACSRYTLRSAHCGVSSQRAALRLCSHGSAATMQSVSSCPQSVSRRASLFERIRMPLRLRAASAYMRA